MVARDLFLQHVWIDSLCMMQDDEDDWQREAAKMGVGAAVLIPRKFSEIPLPYRRVGLRTSGTLKNPTFEEVSGVEVRIE